jgi:cell division protein FtsN
MFGGGSSSAPPQQAAPAAGFATGSTGPAHGDTPWDGATVVAQTSSMVQRGPEEPAASLPWSSGQTQTVAAAEPAASAAPAKAARAAPAGKFKLQVAAVRTRQEAEKLAASLNGYQAVQTGAVQSEIDEAVIGNMGTFYRVKLGPYADAKEPGQLCKTLKPQGFDCMVVTQ